MNLLEKLVKKTTNIRFESHQDKLEFHNWYLANGGATCFGRYHIEHLDKSGVQIFELYNKPYCTSVDVDSYWQYTNNTWKKFKRKYNIGGIKMFKKSDLQIGWILENDCGEKGIWMGRSILGIDWDSDIKEGYLSEDLIIRIALNEIPINKIYKLKDGAYFNRKSIINGNILDLIWQRKILKPITSLDQLEEVRKEMCKKYNNCRVKFFISNKTGEYTIYSENNLIGHTTDSRIEINFTDIISKSNNIPFDKKDCFISQNVYLNYKGEHTTHSQIVVNLEKEGYEIKI